MPQNYSPKIGSNIDIFREIGARPAGGAAPVAAASATNPDNDILRLINSGDVPSLMKAKQLIDQRLSEKTAAAAPQTPALAVPPPPRQPAAPAPSAAPAPTAQPPAAAIPAGPSPGAAPLPSPGGPSPNVLADLTKLVNATKGLVSGAPSAAPSSATPSALPSSPAAAPANPILSNNAVPALPGRPTM